MIFDTDIIIWAQRGMDEAAEFINRSQNVSASIITYMEFVRTARDKKHFALSKAFFHGLNFEILPITPDISNRAACFIEQYSFSHGLNISDALIAATAFERGMPLATANHKHYKIIAGLELVRFTP